MKILGGEWRGRTIPFRPSPALRPTPDKVRKAIMETLRGKLAGAAVLDVYAGTGALGFEALSRGAREATFVEKNGPQCSGLKRLAAELGAGDRVTVIRAEAEKAVARLRESDARFDIVFADPPYERGLAQGLLKLLAEAGPLAPGAWCVLETFKREPMPDRAGPLALKRTAAYGDTAVRYYLFDNEPVIPI